VNFFERDEKVSVQLGDGAVFAKGRVLLDTGGDFIVIDRHGHPGKLVRVKRDRVKRPESAGSRVVGPVAFSCVATEHGWCATQAQARKLTRTDCIQGVCTICDTWAESTVAPEKREPTCPRCRRRLGMKEQADTLARLSARPAPTRFERE
jgi:hypothetical protein